LVAATDTPTISEGGAPPGLEVPVTKSPTKSPTTSPTKSPTKSPTQDSTRGNVDADSRAPTKREAKAPPGLKPTDAPIYVQQLTRSPVAHGNAVPVNIGNHAPQPTISPTLGPNNGILLICVCAEMTFFLISSWGKSILESSLLFFIFYRYGQYR
jgi:hypothetical protein